MFDVVCRTPSRNSLMTWMSWIKAYCVSHPVVCQNLLFIIAQHPEFVRTYLFAPNIPDIRQRFAELLVDIINIVAPLERAWYCYDPIGPITSCASISRSESTTAHDTSASASIIATMTHPNTVNECSILKFVEMMASLSSHARVYWYHSANFFWVLAQISVLGPAEKRLLISRFSMLDRIIDFYLGTQSPFYSQPDDNSPSIPPLEVTGTNENTPNAPPVSNECSNNVNTENKTKASSTPPVSASSSKATATSPASNQANQPSNTSHSTSKSTDLPGSSTQSPKQPASNTSVSPITQPTATGNAGMTTTGYTPSAVPYGVPVDFDPCSIHAQKVSHQLLVAFEQLVFLSAVPSDMVATSQNPFLYLGPIVQMPESSLTAILHSQFLPLFIRSGLNEPFCHKLCKLLCWNSKPNSEQILDIILDAMRQDQYFTVLRFKTFDNLFQSLLSLSDGLAEYRTDYFYSKLPDIFAATLSSEHRKLMINYAVGLSSNFVCIRIWLRTHISILNYHLNEYSLNLT